MNLSSRINCISDSIPSYVNTSILENFNYTIRFEFVFKEYIEIYFSPDIPVPLINEPESTLNQTINIPFEPTAVKWTVFLKTGDGTFKSFSKFNSYESYFEFHYLGYNYNDKQFPYYRIGEVYSKKMDNITAKIRIHFPTFQLDLSVIGNYSNAVYGDCKSMGNNSCAYRLYNYTNTFNIHLNFSINNENLANSPDLFQISSGLYQEDGIFIYTRRIPYVDLNDQIISQQHTSNFAKTTTFHMSIEPDTIDSTIVYSSITLNFIENGCANEYELKFKI